MGRAVFIAMLAILAFAYFQIDDQDYFTGNDEEFSERISNFGRVPQEAAPIQKATFHVDTPDPMEIGRKDGVEALPRFKAAILKNLMQGRTYFPLQIPSKNMDYAFAFMKEIATGIKDTRVHIFNLHIHPSGLYAFDVRVDLT